MEQAYEAQLQAADPISRCVELVISSLDVPEPMLTGYQSPIPGIVLYLI